MSELKPPTEKNEILSDITQKHVKPTLEAEVLNTLVAALSSVDKEARSRLLSTVALFFDLGTSLRLSPANIQRTDQGQIPQTNPTNFSSRETISAKEFLRQKEPKTDVERVACLGFYLTYYAEKQHFKTGDINQLNTDAAQPRFSNPSVAVENSTKQGYLVPGVKGAKQLSASGEQYVQALPDREAAKAVLQRLRPRRTSSKKHKTSNGEKLTLKV